MADKLVKVVKGVKVRVDKSGQYYWDWGKPKAKPKPPARKRG